MRKIKFIHTLPMALGVLLMFSSCGEKQNQQRAPQALPFPVVTVPSQTVTAYATYPTSLEGIINSEVRAKTKKRANSF